jgi:hypothetical protein
MRVRNKTQIDNVIMLNWHIDLKVIRSWDTKKPTKNGDESID